MGLGCQTADLGCPSSTTGTLNAKIGQPNGLTDRRNFGKSAGSEAQRPMFGLTPWFAFLRRALVFFLLRFFDGIRE